MFTRDDLIAFGFPATAADELLAAREQEANRAGEAWSKTIGSVSVGKIAIEDWRSVWRWLFRADEEGSSTPPMWFPADDAGSTTRLGQWMQQQGSGTVEEFHRWSVDQRLEFWQAAIAKVDTDLLPSDAVIAANEQDAEKIHWLPDEKIDIVAACFRDAESDRDRPAIRIGNADGGITDVSLAELFDLVNRIGARLQSKQLPPGTPIAIAMPMNVEAVASYLAIIRAGFVAVSIAESFAAPEMENRLRIADAKLIITAGFIHRSGKQIPLYEKVVTANGPNAIVLSQANESPIQLREGDQSWNEFLAADPFNPIVPSHLESSATINILFSSGTTGDPKAIPWTTLTPLKCAVDGMLLQDIDAGDVICWPTSLGWMMGPWLIFASLLNKATIALYQDAPMNEQFGKFVAGAGVTMLGVVPTIVKAWQSTGCMVELDWSSIKCFSSTGEASTAGDMFYLSWLGGFKPVIEYCGGTEIGGGYVSSTMMQPNIPATFSTTAFGIDMTILDDQGDGSDEGQLFLVPPSIGLSQRLLNRDHHETYFADVPTGSGGNTLRRHGDFMVRLPNGYYQAGGRADDTMNLGGIKVSSVEIERVLNSIDGVRETAAVGVADGQSGPTRLVIFCVTENETADKPRTESLQKQMNGLIKSQLNPLFKVSEVIESDSLPRTASNKIMRRLLRDQLTGKN